MNKMFNPYFLSLVAVVFIAVMGGQMPVVENAMANWF